MLRIAFAGTPDFAVPTLRALAASTHQLVGVLTQPDRPAGRGRALTASPVKRLALELHLPLSQPAGLRSLTSHAELARWEPDVLVVAAYGLILPEAVLALPRLGCLNVHASLLPRWRGAAPIQRAILAGDTETGITIMQIEAALDAGPILAQARVPIDPATNAQRLHDRLAQLGAGLMVDCLGQAEAGLLHATPQPEHGVSYAAKVDKTEARIDWWHSAVDIERQVRAFNPWPVAETLWRGEQLRIWDARAALDARIAGDHADFAQPGNVLGLQDGELLVQCGRGRLALINVQLAGRRIVTAREFGASQSLAGSRFG
jgi:methionyl-tRNA formyltransferase